MPRSMQTSFSAGELSPSLHSHADLAKYNTGLALARNWFVLAQGGLVTRPGFEFVCEVEDSSSISRVIPFQFNTTQTYSLVFTDQRMRVVRNGSVVLESAVNITAATKANPCEITTSGSHGYSTGDDVYIIGIAGMTELNGRFFRITVTGATTFTLNGIDSTGFATYVSGGTVARVYTLSTPWLEADLFRLKYTQSADVMTITHPDYDARDLSRTDHDNWSLSTISFAASVSAPSAGLGVTEQGTGSAGSQKTYRYRVTSVGADGSESAPSAIQSLTTASNSLSETRYARILWDTVAGAEYYNVYKELSTNSGIFGWIGEADEDGSPRFEDYNLGPDMSITPPVANNPFTGADDKPSCVTYFQQRKAFASTRNAPQTLWMTRTADFDNMDYSRPLRADDSIEATINARQVNEIRHLLSLDDLLVFTSGGEWKAEADQDGVLTPANLNFRSQGFRGCSHVPPLTIGETALFVQEKGARIRDIRYTFEDDKYTGNDLTVMARHLFESYEIVDWCYAQEPYSIVWAVRDDGVLLSFTYLREHNVYAWTQHETDGLFESVCSVSEGEEDRVYAVVKRTIDGETKRYVERMHTRLFTDVADAFCVDAGLTYEGETYDIEGATAASPVVITSTGHNLNDGDVVWIRNVVGMTELNDLQFKVANATANDFELTDFDNQDIDGSEFTAYVSGGTVEYCASTITNLHHLEGKTLAILADGNVVEDLVVEDGAVTMTQPAHLAHLGLGYNCDFQTLELNFQGEVVQSRRKQVARLVMRVLQTRGLKAGRDVDTLYDIKERTPAMGYENIDAITGEQRIEILPKWTDFGQVYVRQPHPLPAEVLAVIPELTL